MAIWCIYAVMVLYDTDLVPSVSYFLFCKMEKNKFNFTASGRDKLIIQSVHLKDDGGLYNYCWWVDTWPMAVCYLPKPEQKK